jgi:hypothetical protein
MEVPGKDVSGVLIAVRNDVLRVTDGKQVPWEHTSLTGQVFLKPESAPTPVAAMPPPVAMPAPPATAAPNYDREMEISFWNSVKGSKSPAMLQAYVDRYPSGAFAGLARVMIEEMKSAATPPPPPVGMPPEASRDTPALARALQAELRRVGCDPGGVDGNWGGRAKGALEQFTRHAGVAMPADQPTSAALDAVKAQKGRVCPRECGAGQVEVNDRCVAKAPERPAKRKTTDGGTRAPRRDAAPKAGGGMCWESASSSRSTTLVPCSDPRAGVRAY